MWKTGLTGHFASVPGRVLSTSQVVTVSSSQQPYEVHRSLLFSPAFTVEAAKVKELGYGPQWGAVELRLTLVVWPLDPVRKGVCRIFGK